MFLTVETKRAVLRYWVGGKNFETQLLFECTPSKESSGLQVGTKHVFANAATVFDRDRSPCELQVLRMWIRRRDGLSVESVAKLGLSEDKIGELKFFPNLEPASLEAFVYFNDDLFADIANALKAGRTIDLIEIDIERKGVLGYGWEPDSSRIVWKIASTDESPCVDVTGLKIMLSLFG